MRNLARFLENPFDDPKIALARLLAFATDCLQRMIAQSSGGSALAANIVAVTSAIDLVEAKSTNDSVKLGLRKARKKTKDTFRKGLPAQVEKLAAAITAHFGASSPQFLECLPQGRTIFSACTDDQLAQHLGVLVAGLTTHQAALGAPVVAAATALQTTWEAIHLASETATGDKDATEEEKQLARENLQLMLYLVLVKLMELFPRQPEQLELYMQQSLLELPTEEEEEEPPPPPNP